MFKVLLFPFTLILISIVDNIIADTDSAWAGAGNNGVGFFLYPNPNNLSDFDELEYLNLPSIERSRFSSHKKIVLLVHGFTQNYESDFPRVLIKAYLEAEFIETSNIIAVNWGELSGFNETIDLAIIGHLEDLPLYVEVVSKVPLVGKRIQEFIVFLQENHKISGPGDVHLVGQSLGAHISGMAGMFYKESTGFLLDRITGTDPAGPLFQFNPIDHRLDESDASFVDIVHTNQLGFGFMGSLGHIDFFVNGGGPVPQPGCKLQVLRNPFCSHNTAPHYYGISIRDRTLKGHRVGIFRWETEIFGEFCRRGAHGSYAINLVLPDDEVPRAFA